MYHLNSADGTINYIRIATERSNSIKLGENHRLLSIDRRFSIFNRAESDARRETKKKGEKKKTLNHLICRVPVAAIITSSIGTNWKSA